MKAVGIFEAKTHFTALCDEVVRSGEPTVVSKRGKPLVIVMPAPPETHPDRPDIFAAWSQWETDHPGEEGAPDFPDVVRHRSEPKPNPLEER